MSDRTDAERSWETARAEEQQGRSDSGEAYRTQMRRNRDDTFRSDEQLSGERGYRGQRGEFNPPGPVPGGSHGGGGYQGGYGHGGGRTDYGSGWRPARPSEYVEGGYSGQPDRGYGRPPGFRPQGTGYGPSGGYNAEFERGEWRARPGEWTGGPGGEWRQGYGAYGMGRGGEPGGERTSWSRPAGQGWNQPGRGGPGGPSPYEQGGGGGWSGERGSWSGLGQSWGGEREWTNDRDFGDEGAWGGGAGFRRSGGGAGWGPPVGPSQWQGESGYGGGWSSGGYGEGGDRQPQGGEWSWRGGEGSGGPVGEAGWGEMRGGYSQGARRGWSSGAGNWEGSGVWSGRDESDWREPGPGSPGGAPRARIEPWSVPGPFTGRGPEGYQRSGDLIRDDVCERLTRHGHVDASSIRVRVEHNNEVVLEGTVEDRRAKRMAEEVAESVSGVRDVQNRLRVRERHEGTLEGKSRRDETEPRAGSDSGTESARQEEHRGGKKK